MYRSPFRYYKRRLALHEIETPRHSVQRVFFKCNTLFVLLTLQIIHHGQTEHGTTFEVF